MKIKMPFIKRDELVDGKRVIETEEKAIDVDNTMMAQMRWEAKFPEMAKRENIVDYAMRIKDLKSEELPVIISKLKVLFCFLDIEETFLQFLKLFDFSRKDYVDKLIACLKTAFEQIFAEAAEKN